MPRSKVSECISHVRHSIMRANLKGTFEKLEPEYTDEKTRKEELLSVAEEGNTCEMKNMYHVPVKDNPDEYRWSETIPSDFGKTESLRTKNKRDTYAVIVYQKFIEESSEWEPYKIEINSTRVRPALERTLEGYSGLTKYELTSFKPPFLPFYHRWDALQAQITAECDPRTLQHLQLLKDTLVPVMRKTFRQGSDIEKTGRIAFSDLALVFKPGYTVYKCCNGVSSAGTFRKGRIEYSRSTDREVFAIYVDVVDWDGRRCVLLEQIWGIVEYDGLRALAALDVCPLETHPDKDEIKEKLIARGRLFEKLRGQLFKAYRDEHDETATERVIIDARAFHKFGPEPWSRPRYAKLDEIGSLSWAQSMNRDPDSPRDDFSSPTKVDLGPLTDHECMLAMPTVKCFSMETKAWVELDLTKIHDIQWSERAFDSLVLDSGEKDLLLALADREKFHRSKPFDDFVSGKGQGMIMLLCGPPGVGKTLTAESVAEHLHRPLYRMGAADLGSTPESVHEALQKSLKLCSHWGAILLIDEADVFMEARTADNLVRNELVSVLLRLLEYYSGLMILTTNRIGRIDNAFESRIDLTLTYDPLTEADRRQVWRNFLGSLDPGDVDVDEAALDRLARCDFNGRQIKSAIKTARILAAKKRAPLNAGHLEVVLRLRDKALKMGVGAAGARGVVADGRMV